MVGTIVLFLLLFTITLVCIVYAKADTLESYEHKRELLELQKQFYSLKSQYNQDNIGVPFNTKGMIKFNNRTKQWDKV
jgi:hypothetical protein